MLNPDPPMIEAEAVTVLSEEVCSSTNPTLRAMAWAGLVALGVDPAIVIEERRLYLEELAQAAAQSPPPPAPVDEPVATTAPAV